MTQTWLEWPDSDWHFTSTTWWCCWITSILTSIIILWNAQWALPIYVSPVVVHLRMISNVSEVLTSLPYVSTSMRNILFCVKYKNFREREKKTIHISPFSLKNSGRPGVQRQDKFFGSHPRAVNLRIKCSHHFSNHDLFAVRGQNIAKAEFYERDTLEEYYTV